MIGHEVQGLQVVPTPVVGQQQVVHLAGKGFVGLQDEDVQHGVSWGRTRAVTRPRGLESLMLPMTPTPQPRVDLRAVPAPPKQPSCPSSPALTQGVLGPDVSAVLNEQPHDLLAAHARRKGQRVLPWGCRGPRGLRVQAGMGSLSRGLPLPPHLSALGLGTLVSRTRGGDGAEGGPLPASPGMESPSPALPLLLAPSPSSQPWPWLSPKEMRL